MTFSSPKTPYASVIIPTLRGDVRNVLTSLARQTLARESFEVVVVADGCTQGEQSSLDAAVKDFADTLSVTVVRHKHTRGPAAARNSGAARASGSLLFFTDDDCAVPALWLETHLKMHQAHPTLGSVGGWYHFTQQQTRTNVYAQFFHLYYTTIFQPIDLHVYQGTSDQSYPQIPANNTANLSVRREAFMSVGGFDEDFLTPGGEDAYFALEMHRKGWHSLFIPYPVIHNRLLGSRQFLRLICNRGIGFYVFSKKEGQQHWRFLQKAYTGRWREYKRIVREYSRRHKAVTAHHRALLMLGAVYLFCVQSPVAVAVHGFRWKWYNYRHDRRNHSGGGPR